MSRKLVLCICGFLLMLALSACGGGAATPDTEDSSSSSSNNAATVQPTKPLHWATTHTFTGTGSKKTGTFTVGDDWRIAWSCNPSSFSGMDYNVVVFVYAPGGSLVDSGVNSMCKKTSTHDVTEIHSGGQVYLDVTSEGDWTIQVQEMK